MKSLVIKGARENNLRNIDVQIPREQLVVITGLSGSGKSSLAFNTIYAEGQRRYVESLSAYARQFLEQMGKPDVDSIEGLSPAISIEQRPLSRNPRSTVGTVTEIYDYLRLLFARVGKPHCEKCGKSITAQSVQQIVDQLLKLPAGTRLSVLAPVVRDRKGEFRKELQELQREGYARVNIDGEVIDLHEAPPALDKTKRHTIEVYVDRLVVKPEIRSRLNDSLELALKLAGGLVKISLVDGEDMIFSEKLACIDCGINLPEMSPRLFSFNNPHGACPKCGGLGVLLEFDEYRVVPDPGLSLREGAIEPWASRHTHYYQQILEAVAEHYKFDLFVPYSELDEKVKKVLMWGSGDEEIEFFLETKGQKTKYRQTFEGVIANLQKRMQEQTRRHASKSVGVEQNNNEDGLGAAYEEFSKYLQELVCPTCEGTRLRPEARHVLLDGKAINQVSHFNIEQALAFFGALQFNARDYQIAGRLLKEITSRLQFLASVGLNYLTLDRAAATLSGGEGQRVRLATQIGAALMGVMYILDEPSIGLHKRDHERLLKTLLRLRDTGNSVIVVEHDEDTIRAADFIVDMGPGAGANGGLIVAAGPVDKIVAESNSVTGQFLSGNRRIELPVARRRPRHFLTMHGACQNNLQNIDVKLPLGVLTCICGVSGSGKSTLIIDTLLPALRTRLHGAKDVPGMYRSIEGMQHVDKVIAIDQSPIGRSPRSNPATYIGVFSSIRELFAALPESKVRGFRSGRYSFNVKGGRCEACQGDGVIRISMHFLPDVFVACEVCGGQRYDRETLEVKYKGLSIAEVLKLTVDQAAEVFAAVPTVRPKLQTLREVGLGYLTLGQPANTLSGGEAQRLKLSKELSRRATGRTIYILDEPTTGLHLADIQVLLDALKRLVDAGNSVVVIEHQLDVIKCADYIIDLGPEGGEGGGRIVAEGTPEQLIGNEQSHTARYLAGVI